MNYELHILESLATELISNKKNGKQDLGPKQFGVYKKMIDSESYRIKNTFKKEVFSLKKDKYIEKYIQNHQRALIKLADRLFQKLSPSDIMHIYGNGHAPTVVNIQKHLYRQLEEILSFIEFYFTKYFNQDDNLPERYRLMAQRELTEKNNFLRRKLKSKQECKILNLALHPVDKFQNSNQAISFKRLIYLKEMIKEIDDACLKCNHKKANCQLKKNLLYLNFNSYRYFSYLTKEITNHYSAKETLCGQIETLCYHLKKINQAQIKPGFTYKPQEKPLKEQLLTWILEELSYLEKRQQLSFDFAKEAKNMLNKDFKIVTDHSVSQVAYFIRLLVEVGAIINKNQRELIRFFSSYIKTKNSEHISPESFRTKYYNTEEGTISVVKDLIIKLLNETNKN